MSSVSELIEAWRNKRMSGTGLMRALVSYPEWLLMLSESALAETLASNSSPRLQYNLSPEGKKRLPIFSTDETLQSYLGPVQAEERQHYLKTEGTWIFGLSLQEIDEVWIDPATPEPIFYGQEQFARLRELAAAIGIEKDLSQLRQGKGTDQAVVRLREYGHYRVVVNLSGNRLVMAPDEKGRTLAAVFTDEDTCDAFVERARTDAGIALQPLIYAGRDLFDMLSKMDLTGIVFNCSGPIPPVAFAAAFSQVVLEA